MGKAHFYSDAAVAEQPRLRLKLVDLFSRSVAMGVLTGPAVTRFDHAAMSDLVAGLQRHGIAGTALTPLLQQDPGPLTPAASQALEARIDAVVEALENSAAPAAEWPAMRSVFGDDMLAALLGISLSSLRRYGAAERESPDAVAARLHWLALIVADLAGAYNHFGIRRWFDRPRAQLGGKSPRSTLGDDWHVDGSAARRLRALAAVLSGAQPLAV